MKKILNNTIPSLFRSIHSLISSVSHPITLAIISSYLVNLHKTDGEERSEKQETFIEGKVKIKSRFIPSSLPTLPPPLISSSFIISIVIFFFLSIHIFSHHFPFSTLEYWEVNIPLNICFCLIIIIKSILIIQLHWVVSRVQFELLTLNRTHIHNLYWLTN